MTYDSLPGHHLLLHIAPSNSISHAFPFKALQLRLDRENSLWDVSPPSSQFASFLNKANLPFPPSLVTQALIFDWPAAKLEFRSGSLSGNILIWQEAISLPFPTRSQSNQSRAPFLWPILTSIPLKDPVSSDTARLGVKSSNTNLAGDTVQFTAPGMSKMAYFCTWHTTEGDWKSDHLEHWDDWASLFLCVVSGLFLHHTAFPCGLSSGVEGPLYVRSELQK